MLFFSCRLNFTFRNMSFIVEPDPPGCRLSLYLPCSRINSPLSGSAQSSALFCAMRTRSSTAGEAARSWHVIATCCSCPNGLASFSHPVVGWSDVENRRAATNQQQQHKKHNHNKTETKEHQHTTTHTDQHPA